MDECLGSNALLARICLCYLRIAFRVWAASKVFFRGDDDFSCQRLAGCYVHSMNSFKATHELSFESGGTIIERDVALCNGVLYSRTEWESAEQSDWQIDSNGGLEFQGSWNRAAWMGAKIRKIKQ